MDESIAARFWSKVDVRGPDECWTWTAAQDGRGYGKVKLRPIRSSPIGAHRVSYEMAKGPIPDGLQIDHLCRNTICVNPAHLEAVTPRVNTLRGESPSAAHARKTRCPLGHPLSGGNLYVAPRSGARHCRECRRKQVRDYQARNDVKQRTSTRPAR